MMMFLYGVAVTLIAATVLLMGAGWWMKRKVRNGR